MYGNLSDDRISLWNDRRKRSQELKSLHESKWISNWNAYRAVVEPLTDPGDWWRSNEPVPTVFKIIETILPRLVQGMFEAPDWFTVEARNGRSEVYEMMVYNLLRQVLEDMDLLPKVVACLRYCSIMGHVWGKSTWEEAYQKRRVMRPRELTNGEYLGKNFGPDEIENAIVMYGEEVLEQPSGVTDMMEEWVEEEIFNGPSFDWRSNDRIFPDPTGRGEWYIEEIQTTLDELEDTQDNLSVEGDPFYNTSALAALKQEMAIGNCGNASGVNTGVADARSASSGGVSMEYAREPEVTEGIPEWITSPMRDGQGVSLWQCWGKVPRDQRKDGIAWRLVIIAEGKYVLRDDQAPTPNGMPPYWPIKAIDIPGTLYGDSLVTYIAPLQDQQTRLANMRLDEVFLGVWQQYLFRKGAIVSDNSLIFQPGGYLEIDTGNQGSVADSIMPLPRTPLLPQVWQEDSWRQQQAEHASGATDIVQGITPKGVNTATESSILAQMGNARHVLTLMVNDHQLKKELLKRTWGWLQYRLTQPKFVRMVGEEYAQVDWRDLQIPIDISVGGGLNGMSRQARVQMDQELITLMTSPETAMYFRQIPILKKWMLDRGWKNPDGYLKTEEEIANELYQQGVNTAAAEMGQQQYAAQLAASGQEGVSNGTGSPPAATGTASQPRMRGMSSQGSQAGMGGGAIN